MFVKWHLDTWWKIKWKSNEPTFDTFPKPSSGSIALGNVRNLGNHLISTESDFYAYAGDVSQTGTGLLTNHSHINVGGYKNMLFCFLRKMILRIGMLLFATRLKGEIYG